MDYWIIVDGEQLGPLSRMQIIEMNLDGSTPVWRRGLTDWTTLDQLDDFASPTAADSSDEAPAACPPPLPASSGSHPWSTPQHAQPEPKWQQPAQPARQYPAPQGCGDMQGPAPAYLGWCIVATLLCCTVLGIVSIIYAVKVRRFNESGDYAAAWRASRTLELWLISAIALGIALSPIISLFQMMLSMP